MSIMLEKRLETMTLIILLFVLASIYSHLFHDLALIGPAISEASKGVEIDEKASPFSAPDLNGEIISLEDFQGQKVILFFFTSWCEVCGEQWVQLEQAQKKGMLAGTKLLAVNVTKAERHVNDVRNYAAHLPIQDLILILDEEGVVQDLYKIIGIPTVIFIDESGL